MSTLEQRIAAVIAEHQGYQATIAQSTWVCQRSCGWRGDTNGGRVQWELHVAALIAALFTEETAVRATWPNADIILTDPVDIRAVSKMSMPQCSDVSRWVTDYWPESDAGGPR